MDALTRMTSLLEDKAKEDGEDVLILEEGGKNLAYGLGNVLNSASSSAVDGGYEVNKTDQRVSMCQC